jgi:uncharacterized protein (TIGR02996 family)
MAKRKSSRKEPDTNEQPTPPAATDTASIRGVIGGPVLRGLLADIKANPEDDNLRLILADWLEEQGDPRSEFLRLQCRLARLEQDDPDREALAVRIWEVARSHQAGWLGPLQALGPCCRFERGLIHLACDVNTLLGPEMAAAAAADNFAWMEGLELDLGNAEQDILARALASADLARFSALSLRQPSRSGQVPSLTRWSQGLRALANSPQLVLLKTLSIREASLDNGALSLLLSSSHLGGLTSLDLFGNRLDSIGAKRLAESSLIGRLTHLNLQGNNFGSEGVKALIQSRHGSVLRSLILSGNQVTDEGIVALARCPLLDHCTWLELAHNPITEDGARALFNSPHVARLTHLRLGGDIGYIGIMNLGESQDLPNLTSLDLGYGREVIRDTEVRTLAESELCARLLHLGLTNSRVARDGLEALAAAAGAGRLRSLNLSYGWALDAAAVRALVEGFAQSALVSLDLGGCPLRTSGAAVLAESRLPASLRWLDLRNNYFYPDDVALLASSGVLSRLAYLDLSQNNLKNEGAKALAAADLKNLTSLNLRSCNIGAEGAKALAGSPWLANLGEISLGFNRLGDSGVKALAASPYLARLRSLDLGETRLTGAGALALAESPHLDRLEILDLSGNRLNKQAQEALRRRFGNRVLL